MKFLGILINYIIVIFTITFAQQSWANCTSGPTYTYNYNIPVTTLTIPRDKTPGPIGDVITPTIGQSVTVSCNGGITKFSLKFGSNLTPSSYSPDVYETGVPGIGIKIWDTFLSPIVVGNNLTYWYSPSNSTTYTGGAWLTGIQIQFYVTGPVSPGVITSFPSIESWVNTQISETGGANYNTLNLKGNIVVNAPSCETPDVTVKMGTHYPREFTSVGSTTSASPFDFKINDCKPGLNSISYIFSPATGVSLVGTGNDQYLTLNNQSTASGVGIQVLYGDGSNVPFNTKVLYRTSPAAGGYVIPMKARYIKTASDITGGTADSALVFTMIYE
ncbi:fimbrial protein [Escherichia coli]|nr:fimbrial protein [Escherichia coli]